MSGLHDDDDIETEPVGNLPAFLVEADDQQDANALYKYRDFGQVQEDEDDSPEAPQTPSSRGSTESSIRVQKFPVKLYAILAQKEFHDIICWMPHGRSWKVLKPTMFESLVMPLFFEYSNYHSFNRLVNAWSFRRISSGPDRGSYYHELFLRGKPFLQKYMRRLPKTHKKLPMRKKDEPDFYKLDKTSTLPSIEDAPIPGAAATSLAMRQQPGNHIPLTHHHQSPITSVVTPPHLSPSALNMTGMGSSGMNNGGYMEPALMGSSDVIPLSNGGMNSSGAMGLNGGMGMNGGMGRMGSNGGMIGGMGVNGGLVSNGMSPSRMHGSGLSQGVGPLPPRFNGYNPPADSYEPQDDYDLQPSLMAGRSMGLGLNMNMNSGNVYGSQSGSFCGGDNLYGDNGSVGNVRFGGIPGNMRRPGGMRQQSCMDPIDGPRVNSLGGQQDFYQSQTYSGQSHHLHPGNPQRSFQLQQQFQMEPNRASPPLQAQHLNSMPIHMQQMYGRGMGDDYNASGIRRPGRV